MEDFLALIGVFAIALGILFLCSFLYDTYRELYSARERIERLEEAQKRAKPRK